MCCQLMPLVVIQGQHCFPGFYFSTCAISTVATFEEHQRHDLATATHSTDKTYIGQIGPSRRQAPLQFVAAQVQSMQLHQPDFQDLER